MPFTIENRAGGERRCAPPAPSSWPGGDRQMVDRRLVRGRSSGRPARATAAGSGAVMTASVHDGALRAGVDRRALGPGCRLPFAPSVRLTERFDDAVGRQHVTLTLESRLLGPGLRVLGPFRLRHRGRHEGRDRRGVRFHGAGHPRLIRRRRAPRCAPSAEPAPTRAGTTARRCVRVIDGADLLVNLAGKSVNCRYGPANRAEILRSRVATTRALADAVEGAAQPPPVWFNASTATIYRHAEDRPMTESTGELGEGFSVERRPARGKRRSSSATWPRRAASRCAPRSCSATEAP